MPPFAANWAFFLDIDGTLLDIEGHPDEVRIERPEADLVAGLQRATGGAVALVSGRPLAGIDMLFHPLKLPIAGQHGAERRDARGKRHRHRFPVEALNPGGVYKGTAIAEFMSEAPFAGRLPVFLGDDVTDETGFVAVNRLGGHSVKIGEGESPARWRLADPAAAKSCLGAWMGALAGASANP